MFCTFIYLIFNVIYDKIRRLFDSFKFYIQIRLHEKYIYMQYDFYKKYIILQIYNKYIYI